MPVVVVILVLLLIGFFVGHPVLGFIFLAACIVGGVLHNRKVHRKEQDLLREMQHRREAEQAQEAAKAARERAREREEWNAAMRESADPATVYQTSLLTVPGEVVGYAATADRVVTHKVGHVTDRSASGSSASHGVTHHRNTGSSMGVSSRGLHISGHDSRGTGTHDTSRKSSSSAHAYSEDDIRTEVVDRGQLVLTNRRVVFMGTNKTLEIPMAKVIGFHFKDDESLVIDHAHRENGECYVVHNPMAMKMAMVRRLHTPGLELPAMPAA